MAINDDLIEAWAVDEATGSSAAGALGRADLELARTGSLDGFELEAGEGWHAEPGGFGGGSTYNGGGLATIPQAHRGGLDTVGAGVTLWCRLWPAGGLVQLPNWRQGRQQLVGMAGVLLDVDVPDRNGFGIEADREGRLVVAVMRVEGDVEYVDRYATGASLPTVDGGLRPFSLAITVERNSNTGQPAVDPVSVEVYAQRSSLFVDAQRRAVRMAGVASPHSPDWRAERLTATTVAGSSDVIAQRATQGGVLQAGQLGEQLAASGVASVETAAGVIVVEPTEPPNRWPYATVTLYVDGEAAGSFAWLPTESVDLARVSLGSVVPSVGSFSRAAAWSRVLSSAEISSLEPLAADVTGLGLGADEGAGLGSVNPLLDADGHSGINPEFINALTEPIARVVSDGPQRETRRTNDRKPRVYVLNWTQASGEDLNRVREALELSVYGSTPVRWRHPVDDNEGRVDKAPRWMIGNADELEFEVGRAATGQTLEMTLELREYIEE